MQNTDKRILIDKSCPADLKNVAEKVWAGERITDSDALLLYERAELAFLGVLANYIREKKYGDRTYFNKNFHVEPTNICIYSCKFCSYVRKMHEKDAWEYSIDDILKIVAGYKNKEVSEVHIVGGVHPQRDLHYYGEMLQKIKELRPDIHIKAFTAVELEYMIKKAGLSLKDGFEQLKAYGLDSLPGGGAEIFSEEIRKELCDAKASSQMWLEIHEAAHLAGIPSNATILYGHIEQYAHRIDHMARLRNLQDRTGGFNTFIPLKYKSANNKLSRFVKEVSTIEDLKNFAVARIYLDNFPHLKAYWPMIGKQSAQLSLSFGVDDIDGTIDDSTKIYSMAGAEDKNPAMNTEDLVYLIRSAGRTPVERDTLYNEIRIY
ncbi:MAG: aminofutalosine synthase MqnE [Bacteroidia bacterium]|nr:MAG: aminofutalosine synthase MqnE [Bacteroidia bacterium]